MKESTNFKTILYIFASIIVLASSIYLISSTEDYDDINKKSYNVTSRYSDEELDAIFNSDPIENSSIDYSALEFPCIEVPSAKPNKQIIVYITDTGSKYHRASCGSLYKSKYSINLNDAVTEGYEPCQRCKPKKLDY